MLVSLVAGLRAEAPLLVVIVVRRGAPVLPVLASPSSRLGTAGEGLPVHREGKDARTPAARPSVRLGAG